MDEFIIPVGIDGEGITSGFNAVYDSIDKLTAQAEKSAESVSQVFMDAGADADKLATAVNDTTAAYVKNQKVVSELEKQLQKYKDSATKANDPKVINENIKRVEELENKIKELQKANESYGKTASAAAKEVSKGMQDVSAAIDLAKKKLATLDAGSKEFKQLSAEIKASEISLRSLDGGTEQYEQQVASLKKQLREMTAALAQMKAEGLDNTEVYRNMIVEAGALRDTIGDVNEEISLAGSDTSGIDNAISATSALAGAFGIAEGAQALFGVSSEQLQATLVKLNALMAIMNGLQAVQAELARKDSIALRAAAFAQRIYAIAVGTSTGAMKAFRIALLATGIGAFIVLLGVAISYFSAMGDEADEAARKVADLKTSFESSSESMQNYMAANDRVTKIAIANAKARGASEAEIFELQQTNRRRNAKYIQEEIKQDQDRLKSKKLSEGEIQAINDQIQKNQALLDDKNIEGIEARGEAEAAALKKSQDAAKEAADKAKQLSSERLKSEKEASEKLIALNQQLAASRVEAMANGLAKEKAQISLDFQDKIQNVEREMQLEKDRLANAKNISLQETKDVTEANEARLKLILQLKENEQKALAEADKNNAIEQAKMEVQLQLELEQLRIDGLEKTKKIAQLEADERLASAREAYKNFPEKLATIEKAIQDSRDKIIKDAIATSAKNEIDARENAQTKILETLIGNEKDEAAVARIREALIKDVQAQAARDRFALLAKEYDKGGKLLADKISEQFSNKNIREAATAGKDIFEFLDIDFGGNLTAEQLNAAKVAFSEAVKQYKDAIAPVPKEARLNEFYQDLFGIDKEDFEGVLDSTKQAIQSILDVYSGFLKNRIELKQQEIDQLNEKIDEAQSQLDKELELQKEGYASNVSAKQAEVDALKKERDKALEDQKKNQKEEAKIAIASQAVALASSVANLISAAAQIIKDYSKIPFVGWALGAAAAGAMVGSFVALRGSIKNYQRLEKGGKIGGESHARGGNKYYSADGSDLVEIEAGEWITNKRETARRLPILEAINKGASDRELLALLAGTGVSMPADAKRETLSNYDSSERMQRAYIFNAFGRGNYEGHLMQIAENTKAMADAEKNKPKERRTGNKIVIEKGKNKRTIILPNG